MFLEWLVKTIEWLAAFLSQHYSSSPLPSHTCNVGWLTWLLMLLKREKKKMLFRRKYAIQHWYQRCRFIPNYFFMFTRSIFIWKFLCVGSSCVKIFHFSPSHSCLVCFLWTGQSYRKGKVMCNISFYFSLTENEKGLATNRKRKLHIYLYMCVYILQIYDETTFHKS